MFSKDPYKLLMRRSCSKLQRIFLLFSKGKGSGKPWETEETWDFYVEWALVHGFHNNQRKIIHDQFILVLSSRIHNDFHKLWTRYNVGQLFETAFPGNFPKNNRISTKSWISIPVLLGGSPNSAITAPDPSERGNPRRRSAIQRATTTWTSHARFQPLRY